MTMADFDTLFADNLGDFQPMLMHGQFTGRDNIGRARSSGSLERTGRSSSASIKSQQQRASSLQSHRRQNSGGGASSANFAAHDPFSEINMADIWADQGGSPNGSPGPADTVPLHSDQLLSFRTYHRNNIVLLDTLNQPVTMSMAAQLHGMFFLAESPWDASGGPAPAGVAGTPKELTCYRRNLFQVSGSLVLPHVHSVVVGDSDSEITMDTLANGQRRMIQSLEATISGIENVEHSPVKIITVPWKNAATQNAAQSAQPPPPASDDFPPTANNAGRPMEKEPGPLLFNYPPAYYANPAGIPPEDDDGDSYKWALNWKRLQFRSATANNGRRKDLQQHFLVKLSIYATLFPEDPLQQVPSDKLDKVLICEAFSNAIIVRGRSPRNFSSRNDIPLTGSAIVSSRHSHNSNAQVMSSSNKKARHMSAGSFEDEQKSDVVFPPDLASQGYSSEYLLEQQSHNPMQQIPNDLNFGGDIYGPQANWMDTGVGLPLLPSQASMMQQQFFDTSASFSHLSDPANPARVSLAGLMYDDFNAASTAPQMFSSLAATTTDASMPPPTITHRPSVPRVSSAQSPSMDLLYEYFPIGIEDYMPPVEVVYRPHNAHHQPQVPQSKSNMRSKRLFSETPFE